MAARKRVLGLIGAIGSGKSRVAEELARHGGAIVAGDSLGHEALHQPGLRERICGRWGSILLNAQGEIDRWQLGRIVFHDDAERKALEAIVFPFIERRIAEDIDKAERPFVVLDAAVMLEAGWNKFCDWIVYVHTPRQQRLERLRTQRGWSEVEVNARSHAQLSLTDKVTRADFALDNSGSPETLARQVADLLSRLQSHGMQPVGNSHGPPPVGLVESPM